MSENIGVISKCYTVTYKRESKHHSVERLWQAITDPAELGSWMGGAATVDLRVGGRYEIDFAGEDGVLDGILVRVEDATRLGYVWGWSYVEWFIEPAADGCRYTFVQNGLADRGEDEEGLPAGWHEFFERLDDHLAGTSRSEAEHKARWMELKPAYRTQLETLIRRAGTPSDLTRA